MKRLVENKKTVAVLFAVDENNDVYRIARFTERVHDEEHYYWSQMEIADDGKICALQFHQ